jgi:hypothetical protein
MTPLYGLFEQQQTVDIGLIVNAATAGRTPRRNCLVASLPSPDDMGGKTGFGTYQAN